MKKLLIANRGEIALRISRAAFELEIPAVVVFSEDDADALHAHRAAAAHPLRGRGPAAYLDIEQIADAAIANHCDAIHPGYGFLSENPGLARAAAARGIVFVGPAPETLEIFGDKTRARALAESCEVPVLVGSGGAVDANGAKAFFLSLGKNAVMVIKAIAGGGGRGMRVVQNVDDIDAAFARCRSEAEQAFGDGRLYVEQFLATARHIEVQVLGDADGSIIHLGERECSPQRQHQKLVEIAPCPSLPAALRDQITGDAVRLARAARYRNAGTFEFLVTAAALTAPVLRRKRSTGPTAYAFIEANPRLQVEHTVTEEVMGVDLVRLQLQIASGTPLAALGFPRDFEPSARGFAIQVRINTEVMQPDGSVRPSGGRVAALRLPAGPGVRIDGAAEVGVATNPNFDSLLLKLIVHSPTPLFSDAVRRAARALDEFSLSGLRTNVPFLRRLLTHPDFLANHVDTEFIGRHLAELVDPNDNVDSGIQVTPTANRAPGVGARVDSIDPLAVLAFGKEQVAAAAEVAAPIGDGSIAVSAPMQGTIVNIAVAAGDTVRRGQMLVVMSAMKMEHVVNAPVSGHVVRVWVSTGDTVAEGQTILSIEAGAEGVDADETRESVNLEVIRADLAEVQQRHAVTRDAARTDAVARRRKTGQRTARENIADLCDDGTFLEYGGLTIAAQRQRRTKEDLIANTPADCLVAGIGAINGETFGADKAQCAILSYDYTVLAGTQGFLNHRKKDRLFELAERQRIPLVFFTEGGGGRPGDTDAPGVAGLDCMAFHLFARLSGLVPLIGINSGRCFAGNAALLGCCDVIIATRNSNIGMGGPAMIEGGGLGVFRPEEVGPMNVQTANGVVDILTDDEADAVRVAKQYLSYFQGSVPTWECADQRHLRNVIPENRLRVYDVRQVIDTLADTDSVLELRRHFGLGMVTALARIEGRPVGLVANNPHHLAGAIDSPAADKAARFMQLCDAFDIPIVFLCDTPGIMVGPEAEKTALVRHCSRMFVTGASLTVPFCTIILRKSYGLGAQAMGGGSHKTPLFTVSWPTGEFGGMGLEGAVKLGFRKELAAIEDAAQRKQVFEQMVARAYEHGKALNLATHFEIDDVIDPAESRRWIAGALRAAPEAPVRTYKKRSCVDTW